LGYSSPEGQKVKWADGCPKEHQAEARSNRLVVHRATWADLKNLVLHSSKKKKKKKTMATHNYKGGISHKKGAKIGCW
jgi:hypothetical protein